MAGGWTSLFKVLVKNWPKVVIAFQVVDKFLKNHPDAPAWIRERAGNIRERMIAVHRRRGDAAKIRGTLDIVRDVTHEIDTRNNNSSAPQSQDWLSRANDIERAVRLADLQVRPERKKTLGRLRSETDLLLSEVIETLTNIRSLP